MSDIIFKRKVRDLKTKEEFLNIYNRYGPDKFIILERFCDPISFIPRIIFMIPNDVTLLNEFYAVNYEFTAETNKVKVSSFDRFKKFLRSKWT